MAAKILWHDRVTVAVVATSSKKSKAPSFQIGFGSG